MKIEMDREQQTSVGSKFHRNSKKEELNFLAFPEV